MRTRDSQLYMTILQNFHDRVLEKERKKKGGTLAPTFNLSIVSNIIRIDVRKYENMSWPSHSETITQILKTGFLLVAFFSAFCLWANLIWRYPGRIYIASLYSLHSWSQSVWLSDNQTSSLSLQCMKHTDLGHTLAANKENQMSCRLQSL